jgi:hypothetical protein
VLGRRGPIDWILDLPKPMAVRLAAVFVSRTYQQERTCLQSASYFLGCHDFHNQTLVMILGPSVSQSAPQVIQRVLRDLQLLVSNVFVPLGANRAS